MALGDPLSGNEILISRCGSFLDPLGGWRIQVRSWLEWRSYEYSQNSGPYGTFRVISLRRNPERSAAQRTPHSFVRN